MTLYRPNTFKIVEHRYKKDDLKHISEKWAEELCSSLKKIPDEWLDEAIDKSDSEAISSPIVNSKGRFNQYLLELSFLQLLVKSF